MVVSSSNGHSLLNGRPFLKWSRPSPAKTRSWTISRAGLAIHDKVCYHTRAFCFFFHFATLSPFRFRNFTILAPFGRFCHLRLLVASPALIPILKLDLSTSFLKYIWSEAYPTWRKFRTFVWEGVIAFRTKKNSDFGCRFLPELLHVLLISSCETLFHKYIYVLMYRAALY